MCRQFFNYNNYLFIWFNYNIIEKNILNLYIYICYSYFNLYKIESRNNRERKFRKRRVKSTEISLTPIISHL